MQYYIIKKTDRGAAKIRNLTEASAPKLRRDAVYDPAEHMPNRYMIVIMIV